MLRNLIEKLLSCTLRVLIDTHHTGRALFGPNDKITSFAVLVVVTLVELEAKRYFSALRSRLGN